MKESSYKHNYEYLSIEEAKSIISGTFVQGTTNIGGELVTKSDINKLLTAANKKLTSIVPSTVADNEFVCFFECVNKEEFPDDVAHRWIEVSPIQFTFPANGGSVKITGSYGLTGTLGTRRKVGDINDTITVGANATPSSKSGSKTYHYSNDQSQTPTAKVSWTQPNKPEEFPDDQAHRWIRVQPVSSQISVDGGTIKVTGSYGLTGTYGTEKKVGDITDTIVVERNSTQSPKSGSKTYHYNNNQTDNPTAKITWTQPGRAEEFPDDQAHRWIEITPTNAGNFTEAGGTITVTGSYGLTGSFGTKKTVGQINDTITVERNTTTQTKSGSKTYYYNNTSGTAPSATVTWTQDARSVIVPTSVHVTNIILHVGQNQQIQYYVTPSNADVDTCTYEVTSGSDYVHITDGAVYADAVGEAVCKITINGTIESTFQVSVTNNNVEKFSGDVFIIQAPAAGDTVIVDFHSPEYCLNPYERKPENHNYMVYDKCHITGIDHGVFYTRQNIIIDVDKIRETYKQIKNKPSLIKGKTIEQACQIHGQHYIYIYLYSSSFWPKGINTVNTIKCRGYKKSSNSNISFDPGSTWVTLNGYTPTGDIKNINYLTYGTLIDYTTYGYMDDAPTYDHGSYYMDSDYFSRCGTLVSYIRIDLDSNSETSVFDFVSSNDGYIEKGYYVTSTYYNDDIMKEMTVDYTQNSLDITDDYIKLNITINKINNSTDISNLRGSMAAWCFCEYPTPPESLYGTDSNGAFFNITDEQTLPYTTQINIPKKHFNKVQLRLSALNTDNSLIYRSAPIEIYNNGSTQ